VTIGKVPLRKIGFRCEIIFAVRFVTCRVGRVVVGYRRVVGSARRQDDYARLLRKSRPDPITAVYPLIVRLTAFVHVKLWYAGRARRVDVYYQSDEGPTLVIRYSCQITREQQFSVPHQRFLHYVAVVERYELEYEWVKCVIELEISQIPRQGPDSSLRHKARFRPSVEPFFFGLGRMPDYS
jgi:hypothetical protein